jgi:Ankyrin repeats (3 copies)
VAGCPCTTPSTARRHRPSSKALWSCTPRPCRSRTTLPACGCRCTLPPGTNRRGTLYSAWSTTTHPLYLLAQRTAEGLSLGHLAAGFNRSLDVVKYVMGLSPTAFLERGSNGWLPLHLAARHGAPVQVVTLLADACPHALEVEDDDGCLPIHVAAQYATFEVVKVLVDARPQTLMCMSGNRGRHPLHVAARHSSSSDVVKPLVFRCPRVLHVRTPEGETAGRAGVAERRHGHGQVARSGKRP